MNLWVADTMSCALNYTLHIILILRSLKMYIVVCTFCATFLFKHKVAALHSKHMYSTHIAARVQLYRYKSVRTVSLKKCCNTLQLLTYWQLYSGIRTGGVWDIQRGPGSHGRTQQSGLDGPAHQCWLGICQRAPQEQEEVRVAALQSMGMF